MAWFHRRPHVEPAQPHRVHRHEDPPNAIGWVKRVFQPPPAPTVAEDDDHHETDPGYDLATPAHNDMFDFHVTVHLDWCVTGRGGGLAAEIPAARDAVRQQVRDVVRAEARTHMPFRPAAAEESIQRELDRRFRTPVHECDAVIVRCTPRVEVTLSEEVREQRRELGQQLLRIEAQTEITKLHIEKLAELRELWLDFFDQRKDDYRTRFAVRLAEHPTDAYKVMAEMLDERRKEAGRLMDIVGQIVGAQHTANVYDLVVGSETVLRRTLEVMGVPVPLPDDSPFDFSGELS